jgi:hypothetical protein
MIRNDAVPLEEPRGTAPLRSHRGGGRTTPVVAGREDQEPR